MKKEIGKVHSVEQFPILLVNNEKFKYPTEVAKAFNNFFITVTEKLNIWQIEEGAAISVLKDSFPGNFPSLQIIPITEAEKKKKKSSVYDELTSNIPKVCASLISHPLSYICNHSLYTGILYDCLKIAVVKPLYKKGGKLLGQIKGLCHY